MNELALFAGIGGGILGGMLCGFTTVCAVEIEPYCREVLLQRQRDGILPWFPIWDNVQTFNGKQWRGVVDIISAGFPCQPFSVAGKQKADLDERNMWPDTLRIIGEVRPEWCLLENVPGLLAGHGYYGEILRGLAEIGYSARWGCLSASTVGAPHKRERLWIVAHAECMVRETGTKEQGIIRGMFEDGQTCSEFGRPGETLPDTETAERKFSWASRTGWDGLANLCSSEISHSDEAGLQRHGGQHSERECACQRTPWACCLSHEERRLTESGIRRISNGIPRRVDRLKAVGNAQVPAVATTAWQILSE